MVPIPAWSRPHGKKSGLDEVSWPSLDEASSAPSIPRHSCSHTPSSPDSLRYSSPLLSDEGDYDSRDTRDTIDWPSKREDCEWMAGKVTQLDQGGRMKPAAARWRGKHRELESTMYRNEVVGYGKHPTPPSSRPSGSVQSRKKRSKLKKKRNDSALGGIRKDAASSSSTRVPLRDITGLIDNGTAEGKSSALASLSSGQDTTTDWEQTLRDLLARTRDGSFLSSSLRNLHI